MFAHEDADAAAVFFNGRLCACRRAAVSEDHGGFAFDRNSGFRKRVHKPFAVGVMPDETSVFDRHDIDRACRGRAFVNGVEIGDDRPFMRHGDGKAGKLGFENDLPDAGKLLLRDAQTQEIRVDIRFFKHRRIELRRAAVAYGVADNGIMFFHWSLLKRISAPTK